MVQAETVSAPVRFNRRAHIQESSIEDIVVVESVPASFSEPVRFVQVFHLQELIIEESTLPASVFSESVRFVRSAHVQEVVEELGATELGAVELGATELVMAQIGATELGVAQTGATELDAMEQRLLMPVSVPSSSHNQENQSGESMIPDQVMDATPAIQSVFAIVRSHIQENITIEELAALDPAVIVESAPIAESVNVFSPSHIQYIAEKEELKETALLSYNVRFVHHSDMQTIHIEEHVPALTYGSAPTPIPVRLFTDPHIQNCTESLVFMPVTLCYPLPKYVHLYLLLYSQDMAYVCDAMVKYYQCTSTLPTLLRRHREGSSPHRLIHAMDQLSL